jgi:hypothetical protein
MNKKLMALLPAILMASFLLSGCQAIGDIFKAGMWTGVIVVILIVAIVIFIISKLFSRNKN